MTLAVHVVAAALAASCPSYQAVAPATTQLITVSAPRLHTTSASAYEFLAVVGFNVEPMVPGRGSGIFLHVQVRNSTNGCVSLPRPQLVRILRWLRPSPAPQIVIGLNLS
jgi:hypothetical protein